MNGKGNRGFADLMAGEGPRALGRLPPRTGVLSTRENRLSELAGGSAVTRVHELVDPARCRIWAAHNRNYAALDEISCADLIESMRAQGRQEVPAIVRRVQDDPVHAFEVICGARRHWTVSWLRAHDHPEFRFLVEPREMTDEEAFRVADLENRSRKDLTDWERASDYARAVERYYDGSQQRMAERLQVGKSWLSRYLELAKLPETVVAAFGTPAVIGISHAAKLAPLLRPPFTRALVEQAAAVVAAEQRDRRETGLAFITPAQVLLRLTNARPASTRRQTAIIVDHNRQVLVKAVRSQAGRFTLSISAHPVGRLQDILEAVKQALEKLG